MREDLEVTLLGVPVELTGKQMNNGEVRRRVRLADGVTFHHTESSGGGLQQAHFHKGLWETYVVVRGTMVFLCEDPHGDGSLRTIQRFLSGDTVSVGAEEVHNLFLYPDTTIVTVVFGSPVPNPEREGNDWWPAAAFDAWCQSLSIQEMERIASGGICR